MQKRISTNQEDAKWNSRLIKDLVFIKQKLRYPLRRMTVMPLIGVLLFSGFVLRYIFLAFYLQKTVGIATVFLIGVILIPLIIGIRRYIDIIYFKPLATGFPFIKNMQLLEAFLKEEQLVVFRHPESPGIYQIISKNISAVGDEREVMIFIADDNRILINSHFTTSRKWNNFSVNATHKKEMVRLLKKWLQQHTAHPPTSIQKYF